MKSEASSVFQRKPPINPVDCLPNLLGCQKSATCVLLYRLLHNANKPPPARVIIAIDNTPRALLSSA